MTAQEKAKAKQDEKDGVKPFNFHKLWDLYYRLYGSHSPSQRPEDINFAEQFCDFFGERPICSLFLMNSMYKSLVFRIGRKGWNASESLKLAEEVYMYPEEYWTKLIETIGDKTIVQNIGERAKNLAKI